MLDSVLKSEAFFSKGKGHSIEFVSKGGCKQSSGKIWELTGELVIKELRKPLTLIVNYSDIKEHLKRPVALFYLFGKISLKEMGLGVFHEKGISDEILLNAEIFMFKKTTLDE
jgi:polyisoprenoid-binding protein YceI